MQTFGTVTASCALRQLESSRASCMVELQEPRHAKQRPC